MDPLKAHPATGELVTDAMVDEAAEAAYTMAAWDAQNFTGTNWAELDPAHRTPWLREAEAALEVVAPRIAAKALRDEANELRRLDRAVEAMRALVEVRERIIAGFLEMMTRAAEDAQRPEWGES